MKEIRREKSIKELTENLELIMKVTYPHAEMGDQLCARINSLAHESLKLIGSLSHIAHDNS